MTDFRTIVFFDLEATGLGKINKCHLKGYYNNHSVIYLFLNSYLYNLTNSLIDSFSIICHICLVIHLYWIYLQ